VSRRHQRRATGSVGDGPAEGKARSAFADQPFLHRERTLIRCPERRLAPARTALLLPLLRVPHATVSVYGKNPRPVGVSCVGFEVWLIASRTFRFPKQEVLLVAVRRTSLAIALTAGLALAGVAFEASAATTPSPKASTSTTTTTMKKKAAWADPSAASTTTTTMKKK